MRNLMSHHPGQFSFIVCCHDQARIHIKEAAREGKSVDIVGIDDLDSEGNERIRISHEILPCAIDVLGDDWITTEFGSGIDFLRILLAHRNVPVETVPVAQAAAAAYVAITDSIEVTNAAIVISLYLLG